ncbi:hypothetical protein QJS10_CPA06g00475 [Acorus calamus]|uniref:Uncharacterized protein n=1 Tax=Acorus calamus TaxID=4465 RepID=A0AAV9EM97_ACOCL|nr:hypothetical protein QJS10_CPA06g00475 [Acorus calamus]
MGRPCFLAFLLISSLLTLSFSKGFGRRVVKIERGDLPDQFEVGVKKGREMMELMDYQEPGANTNPHLGGLFSPPPPNPLN